MDGKTTDESTLEKDRSELEGRLKAKVRQETQRCENIDDLKETARLNRYYSKKEFRVMCTQSQGDVETHKKKSPSSSLWYWSSQYYYWSYLLLQWS